nr:hypothetical protein BaRGS_019978 [Batillaria attramentaria]
MPGMAGTAVSEAEGLQTEGERQLKAMAQRQLRKDVTMTQLASERRQFTGAGQFKPVTKEIRGILQLQAYQEVAEGDNRVEMLRQCGLSEDEIRLKLASEGTAIGHNNTASRKSTFGENPDVQQEKLKAIEAKIKEKEGSLQNPDTFRGVKEISRQELDLEKSLFSGTDREGAALSHMLTRVKAKVTGDPNDPINQLPQMMAEIEEKVQERIREKRRWRKRNRKNKRGNAGGLRADAAAEEFCNDDDDDDAGDCGVIGCLTREEMLALRLKSAEHSDSSAGTVLTPDNNAQPSKAAASSSRAELSCEQTDSLSERCFTDTEGTSCSKVASASGCVESENKRKVLKEHVEILPEEFITENRLSLEDIRKLPKFQNYEAGNPANVLYLKNLSPRVSEHDLVALFGRFQKGPVPSRPFNMQVKEKTAQAQGRFRLSAAPRFPSK